MLTNPLGLGNWQMTQKTVFALHNKTGSDVFIGASNDGQAKADFGNFSAVPPRRRMTPATPFPDLREVRAEAASARCSS